MFSTVVGRDPTLRLRQKKSINFALKLLEIIFLVITLRLNVLPPYCRYYCIILLNKFALQDNLRTFVTANRHGQLPSNSPRAGRQQG